MHRNLNPLSIKANKEMRPAEYFCDLVFRIYNAASRSAEETNPRCKEVVQKIRLYPLVVQSMEIRRRLMLRNSNELSEDTRDRVRAQTRVEAVSPSC